MISEISNDNLLSQKNPQQSFISNIELLIYSLVILFMVIINLIPWEDALSPSEKMFNYHHFLAGLLGILYLRFGVKKEEISEDIKKDNRQIMILGIIFFFIYSGIFLVSIHLSNGIKFGLNCGSYSLIRAISVAFCEELFYRGIIIGIFFQIKKSARGKTIIILLICILSSLLWTTLHFNYGSDFSMLIQLFVVGSFFAVIFYCGKMIKISIILHASWNFLLCFILIGA
ncbi:CPBP family glutamic-type intramembrane protease [Candidatus Lokiarchaeum ossiferum]|uniref:CPBP family glutamic-type intramembrane protease n=1 Tax=Candidatus Lokiarchaeum ossiferum TaxID=2951803 RepID=UPI00352D35AB